MPLYDTLGPDAVPYVINQTELRVLFCGKKQFDVIMDCAAKCPSLKIMVLLGPLSDEQQARAAVHNIEVKYFDEVEAKGKAEPCPADPALPRTCRRCAIRLVPLVIPRGRAAAP